MSKQPEALRLADWIEEDMSCQGDAEIAAELRRLHALCEEMGRALSKAISRQGFSNDELIDARASLAKWKESK